MQQQRGILLFNPFFMLTIVKSRWCARWNSKDGKKFFQTFSTQLYGFQKAKELAEEVRLKANAEGARRPKLRDGSSGSLMLNMNSPNTTSPSIVTTPGGSSPVTPSSSKGKRKPSGQKSNASNPDSDRIPKEGIGTSKNQGKKKRSCCNFSYLFFRGFVQ